MRCTTQSENKFNLLFVLPNPSFSNIYYSLFYASLDRSFQEAFVGLQAARPGFAVSLGITVFALTRVNLALKVWNQIRVNRMDFNLKDEGYTCIA